MFSGMASKRLINTEPSLFKHAYDQHFVENMRVFRSNHAVSDSRWHSKRWRSRIHSACEKSVRFPINTDHLFFRNASYPESEVRITPTFCPVLPLHFYPNLTFLIYAYREGVSARELLVSGEICRSRYCSQYIFFRMAVRNYLTSYQVRITCARTQFREIYGYRLQQSYNIYFILNEIDN